MDYPIPAGAKRVLERLAGGGFEAYLVGGCVRDLLRGVTPQDYDICTAARPAETAQCLAGIRLLETGARHGTLTALLPDGAYEVTTYRADGPYSDGRRPDRVDFVSDLAQDLARRDFTVNAMAMDLSGAVFDPFGGRADLDGRLIRCVGEPERRFREDGLRLMRCLRFSACLDFAIHPYTARAVHENLAMLDRVAAERVRVELCKLLTGPRRVAVLREFPDVLCRVWPELEPLLSLEQNNPWHRYGGWEHTLHALEHAPAEATVALAVLLHDIGKPETKTTDDDGVDHFYGHPKVSAYLADGMLRDLRFDNATRERVVRLVEVHDAPIQPTEKSVRRWLGRLGEEAFFQLLELKRCDTLGHGLEKTLSRLDELDALAELARGVIAQGQCFSMKDLAVDGRDVLAAGVPAGPEVGRVLQALLDRVVDGTLPNRREELLEEIKKR